MKTQYSLLFAACTGILTSCAATIPPELSDARQAYARASNGPAARVAPAELHVANQALARAEQSFTEDDDSYTTRDLAYVAIRKAELAEATAAIDSQQKNESAAKKDYRNTQGELVAETKEDLDQTRAALAQSETSGSATAAMLLAAEKRAADAQAALAKLAAVKEDSRGMVITLSGSVLFASNQSTLLPEARARLDQVAAVLLTTRERNITIEGFTDSQGTDAHNLDLSQRRADAVRNYLVAQGYEPDRIKAHGIGEGQPVADNSSPEGRANNRRVEIIIARDAATASNR